MNTQNGIYGYYDKEKKQIVYVGQSHNIFKRHREHMNPIRQDEQVINKVLQNNPDRYELFIIDVRPGFSKEHRDILERHYIEFYNTFVDENKFNYTPGGDFIPSTLPDIAEKISKANSGPNNPFYGKKHTEETKMKMSKAHLGKHHSEKTKRKMSEAQRGENHPFYGKKHTEETKKKISKALSGSNHPFYGKKHAEETKKKIREARLGKNNGVVGENHPNYGKHLSEESKMKMSKAHLGKHHSEESMKKMSLHQNTTGYFRVTLQSCPSCKSGKTYKYNYYDDGKQKSITSVNIEKLKEKVLERGLPWEKLN